MKFDPNQPPVLENGHVQLRMSALMAHPEYSLDKAFNGRGPIKPNRNEELEAMDTIAVILDARRALVALIDSGDEFSCRYYGYAGFMSDTYDRAVFHGYIEDERHDRRYYVKDNNLFAGKVALWRERSGNTD